MVHRSAGIRRAGFITQRNDAIHTRVVFIAEVLFVLHPGPAGIRPRRLHRDKRAGRGFFC